MKLSLYRVHLPLAHPFTISRGTITTQPSLIVELQHDGATGLGEVTENAFYGHSFDSITESIRQATPLLARYETHPPQELWSELMSAVSGDTFAASAVDMAAHDLWSRRQAQPAWQSWDLTWAQVPESSFTIGIDHIETMVQKLQEQPDWNIYKIKLGTDQDLDIVTELRRHTSAVFRVDANCGWTVDQTIEYSAVLKDLGVEFIEQPLPLNATDHDRKRVYENSHLPIIADENCQRPEDVGRCHGRFHGVNVKICKCGGLTPALSMLREARSLGMKTMVGCMVESSVGISGAAQLLPLLDYADLDGAVLLRDEPCSGVVVAKGLVHLTVNNGTGAVLHRDRLAEF